MVEEVVKKGRLKKIGQNGGNFVDICYNPKLSDSGSVMLLLVWQEVSQNATNPERKNETLGQYIHVARFTWHFFSNSEDIQGIYICTYAVYKHGRGWVSHRAGLW